MLLLCQNRDQNARIVYKTPRLTYHGDVRDVTMGGTGFVSESGGLFFRISALDADLGFRPDPSSSDQPTGTP